MVTKIEITNLSFSYGVNNVLCECNALFESGNVYVLLGNNGVGKSTLFKCLIKQCKVSNNQIYINEKDINSYSYIDYSKEVSFVSQLNNFGNLDISVRDYLVQGRTPHLKTFMVPGKNEYVCMYNYAKEVGVDNLLSKQLSELSGGELQMINITRALIQETPIIILDEPLSALDIKNQFKILSLMKKMSNQDKIIIFSSHNPSHAVTLKSNVLLMKDGKILAAGKYNEIINGELLSKTYGCDVAVNEYGDVKFENF